MDGVSLSYGQVRVDKALKTEIKQRLRSS